MDLRQRNRRFSASVVALTVVGMPLGALFISQVTRAAGGTVGSGDCQASVSQTSTVTATSVNGTCIYTFTNGVNSFAPPTGAKKINFLVVGGGGGGGSNRGGGGGAGGFYESSWTYTSGSVDVVVGGGGAGGATPTSNIGVQGTDGGTSSITGGGASVAAGGGGGGGAHGVGTSTQVGRNGVALANGYTGPSGSGGGASMNHSNAGFAGGTATAGSGYANAGAASPNDLEPNRNTGGGGGAGGAGVSGSGGACDASTGVTPAGGAGRSSSIGGSSVTYAAGGGGADARGATEACAGPDTPRLTSGRGLGGSGIGGNGAALGGAATSASANTGSGGGAGNSDSSVGGDGGSGVVILSVDATKPVSSGTTTTDYLPKATNTVSVAYSATDTAALSSVSVFYSVASDLSSPTQCGSATGLSGTSASGNITCTLPSAPTTTKTYYLYTVATDSSGLVEDIPGSSDDSFIHDAITPLSTANIVRVASNTAVIPVEFTATDSVGLDNVKAYVTINSNLLGGTLCGTTSVTGTSASGTVSCTVASPSNGTTYYFYTVATDLAGQVEASADYTPGDSARYDTTKPSVSSGPAFGARVKSSGAISATPSEAGTLYFVSNSVTVTNEASLTSLNDNQYNSVSVGSAYAATDVYATGLSEGSYKLYIVDEAGNVSNVYAYQVVVDDTAPTKPTGLGVYSWDDTGTSNSDGITKITTPNLVANTSEGNGQVTFTAVKGASTVTCTDIVIASGSTGTTYCGTSTYSSGTWTVTAVHTDAAGNVSPTSDAFTMVIDTTAPARPSDADLVDAYDYGNSSTDNITSASYAYYKTTSPSGESNGMVELKMKSGSTYVSTCTYYDTDTLKQCQLEPNANDGTFQVEAWYYDQAGNGTISMLAIGFTYDRTAPVLTTSMSGTIGLTQTVSGSSNSTGRLWLVDGYANSSSWPDFTGLLDNQQNFSSYLTANTSATVAATGLADGWYYMYATDVAGNISARSTNSVTVDATLPTVTQITATNGRYKAATNVDISVSFSENVVVTPTPRILLNIGTNQYANYLSGSGTNTLMFRYVVPSSVNSSDLEYASTTALASGTIKDAYENSAVLTLPATGSANSLAGTSDVIIDTTAPTASFTNPSSAYSNATSVTYTFTFSEQVSAPTAANFSNTGTSTGCSYSISTSNNLSYTVVISGCTDGTIIPRLAANAVNDLAGNAGPGSAVTAGTTNFDHVAPTITACTCAKASGTAGTFTSVTLNSNGTVYLVKSTVTVNSLSDITSAADNEWNSNSVVASTSMGVYATGLVEGTYKLYATDLAGNFSVMYAGGSLIVDNVAPTFTVVGGTYGNGKTISSTSSEVGTVWYILQSVSVPSPVTADFLLNSPAVSNKRVVTNIVSANTPTLSQSIVQTSQFPSGIYDAYAVDEAGNVSTVLSSAVTLDTTAPTLTSISSSSPNGTYLYGQTINIDVTFSKPMKANSTVNLILETGTSDRTVNYSSGTGTNVLTFVYTVQSGDTSSDLELVSSATLYSAGNLSDIYGNTSAQGCCNNFAAPIGAATSGSLSNAKDIVVDGVVPVVSSNVNSANGNQSSYYTTVTFSGDVTDFDLSDITRGGSATGCTTGLSATSASVYVISYTGCSDGTISSSIRVDAVTFASGNRGPKSANLSATLTKDTAAPIVTQSPAATYFTATVAMSYSVNETSTVYLVNTNVSVTNVASITSAASNQWRSASYVSGTSSINGANLADGTYKFYAVDPYGNLSNASTATYTLDTVAPTASMNTGMVIIGGSATVRSNETGTLYLVKSTVTVTTISSILSSGSTNYKSQAVSSANTDQSVAVSGLVDGTYYAYASDGAGNLSAVSTNSISVDNTAPTVTNVTANSSAGNYIIGQTVLIDVLFNDIVNVDTTNGTPTLLLETGTTDRNATYVSGSGTNTLRFSYTVQAGDTTADLNYQSTTALANGGGTIKDNNENNATLTLPSTAGASSLASRSAIFVKGTRISVVGSSVPTSPTTSSTLSFGLSFSEAAYGLTTSDFTFGGTATGCTVSSVGTPTSSASITVTGCSDGTVILKLPALSMLDFYNNAGPAAEYSTTSITVDRTGPVPTFTIPTTPTTATSLTYTVTFNELMNSLAATDFQVTGTATGCSVAISAAAGTTVTVTLTSCSAGTVILSLKAGMVNDSLSNTGPATLTSAATVTRDLTAPTVSSFAPDVTPTNAAAPTFALTFSEEITGLSASDFTVAGTATACTVVPGSATGTVISISVTGCSGGTVILTLKSAMVADIAGNSGPASAANSSTLTIDRIAPSAAPSPVLASSSDVGVSASDSKTNLTTVTISATTPEANGSIVFTATLNGTSLTCSSTVTSSSGSCVITGLTEGSWAVTAVFTDAAGNAGPTSSITTLVIDTTAPTVSITAPSSPIRSLPATFTVTFSESISGLAASDFTNNGGSSTGCTFTPASSSGTTINVSIDMCSDGTFALQLAANAVTDVSGNAGPAANEVTSLLTIDNGPPVATVTAATLQNTQNATVRANKVGTVYLVKSTVSVAAEADITSAANNAWNSVSISTIDTDTSLALTGLSDGTYKAYAVDGQSRVSVASTASVVVDTTSPTAPVSIAVDSSSDTGSSSSDGLTKDNTPTIRVVASENGGTITVTATRAFQTDVVCTVAGSTTGSTCDLGTLVDGTWTLTAVHTDAALNVSSSVTGSASIDTVAPTVSGVSTNTANGSKKSGVAIDIRVAFDGTVGVNTSSGSPTVTMETGSTDRAASFTSGSNSSVLVFTYTVQSSDTSSDLDYVATNSLALNGAVIADDAGNNATLTLASPGAVGSLANGASIVIDTTAPLAPTFVAIATASDSGSSSSDGITNDNTPTIRVVAAENGATVTVTASKTGQADVVCTVSGSTTGSTCDLATLADGVWTLTAVQSDSATNMSSSVTSSVTIDTASPSAPISVVLATASDSGPSSNDGLTNDNTPTISVATAENGGSATVTASRALQSDVTCTLSGSTSGSTCDLTTLVDGSWTMTAVQTDVAGNVSSSVSGSFIIDTVAPSATSISSNTTNGAKKAGTAIDVRVTFDGAVGVNSTSGSPTLLMETGSTDHTASFTSGSNSSVLVFTYTVQSGDTSSDLDYVATNSLALNGAVVADDAGNSAVLTLPSPGASGSLAANKAIVIDTSAPTAPVLTTATITTTGNAVVRSAETGTVYLVKTSVNVGSLADITSANGALWNQVSIASANTDTNLAATGLADGDYRAYAVDAAENVSASSIGVVTIDTSVPTITIAASPTSVSSGGTSSLTFTLSESLTGFDATDVSAGLGTIGSFSGSGTQYTATFTASAVAGGTAKITVAANAIVDAAGNSSAESTANITVASPTGTNGRQAAVDNNTNYIIEQFTTAGTYTFHVPKNVTSLEYIVIGGGGGGGGGGYVAGANGGGGGGGGAGSLRMGTLSVLPDTNVGVRVGPGGAGGVGGRPNSLGLERGAGGEDGTQSGLGSARANGGYGGCASALNASVSSCGYLLLTDGYGGFGGSNAEANGGNRASILGGGGGGGAGSYGVGGDTSTSAGGIGGGGTPATFYGISDTFGTGGNGGPGAAGALAGTAGAKRGNGGNGGGGGLNGSNGGAGGNGSDGFVAVRYALPTVTQPDLTDASDTGDSSTDNLTKLTTPTFTGTAPVGATVQLYVDSVASGSTCTASSDTGDFSCTTGVLSHGSHSITAKSSILLAGGVAESTSTALTINVDTVNPVATLTSATLQWGYNGSGQSNEVGVVYLVKTTETVTDEASILALADNVWNYANIGYVNTNATISTLGLTSGTYKLYALDAAGNLGLASSSSITYFDDTTAPTPSLTTGKYRSVDSATISSTEMGTMYLVKSTITVNSVSDITNALSTARKSASVNAANVTQSLSLSGLSEGTYYLYAIDGAGNLSSASTSSIVIDNTSPTVSSFTSASSSYVVRTFDLTLTMSESVTGLSSSDFSNTGTASSCTFTPDASSGTTFTVTATCTSDGTVVARLSSNAVTDLAGNTGPASQASAASVTLGATPSKLVITTNSSGTASGAAFTTQPVVSLANAQDLIVTSYAATVTASITQVNGTGSLEGIITAAVDTSTGRATFSDLGITGTAGTAYTITYSSGSLTVATQTVTVSVGAAKKLEVTTQPVGGASGAAFSTQPVVRIVDSGSNPVIAATASVSVTTSTGTIGGTRPKVTVSGVAAFTDLTFSGLASQNHVLTFSATALTSATSSTFNVTAGAPTQLVLTTQSVGTESGAAFTTQPVLEVRDSGGNKVTASSALVTAHVSSGAVLEGTTSATASLGVATYSNLGISGTAGTSYTVTYSSTGLSSAVQAVTPTVGPATKLQVSTQPVGAGAGAALATQPIVEVVDSGGNVIVGSNASIAVTASGGTLGGTTTKAASSGVATFTNLTFAGTAGTNYRLEFTSFGLTSATSSDFTVSVGAPTHLSITTQPIGAGAGALLATQPVVNVLDAGDNVVTASSAAIVVTASGGTLGGTTTVSASNGVATYSTLTFAGTISTNYALAFSSSGLGTVQSNNFTVTVGADYQLAINTSAAGAKYKTAFTTQPIIEVQDTGGNRTGSSSTITATISSGTLLSNSGTTKTATASNGHATFSGLGIIGTPGSYTVTYSSGSLQTASQSITLNKADQSINTASVADRVFSTTAFAMSSSPDSGLTVSYVSTTTAVCTVSNADVTMVGIGTCSITASQSGNVNYNAATNEIVTFAISRATPTVTFGSLTNKTYGDSSFTVQVDADMPVAVSFAGTSGVCSVGSTILSGNRSSATVSIIGAGSCSVTASRAQDATYFAATAASGSALTRTFSIAKAAGSIAFDPTTLTQTYNSNGRVITATVNSGTVTITYTGIAPTVYAPSTNPPVNAGSYAVVAVQNAANYDATAAEILTVNKAQGAVVIDANSLAQTYSGTSRSVLVSSTTPSGLATKLTYSGVNGTTYVPSQYAPTDAGTYNVNAVLDDMNYEAIATGTLTVGLGVQSTVTLINRSSTTFGTSVTLSAVGGTGTGPLTYATTSGPCTVDSQSGLMTPTGAGACVVTATRGASGNFGATSSSPFTVTINQAPQTVEFTSVVPTRPLPGNTYTPTATASSGLAPTIAITQGSGTVCTLSGGVVTIVASGTCEVTASQQGDANWLAASPVVQTMVAGRLNQSITFASIPTKTFGDPVFSLGATASSGRIVEYAVLSGSTSCAVDTGGVVTLAAIGSCVIEASQPGDTVYSPAATIRRTIIVEPTTPSAPFLASVSASDGSVTVAYNAPSSDGGLPVQAYSVEVRFAGSDRSFDVTKTDCTASLTCYIDGLTNGRSYNVTVAAVNAIGVGARSASSPLILPILNPQAVRGLTARAGNQIINVEWSAPSNLGGGTFVRYEVSIRNRSGSYQSPISISNYNTTSYQFTGLDNGTSYDVKIVTITSSGATEFTGNTAEVFEMPRTVASVPRDLTIAAPTGRVARVSWRIPQSDGGSSITSYVVNAQGNVCVFATPSDVVCEIAGLTPGSPLTIDVRAVNGVGQSQAATASMNLPNRPTAPIMRSVVVNASTALASWLPPTSDGGQPVLGYLVYISETGSRVSTAQLSANDPQCSTLETSCQIEGLDPTKTYAFVVRAINAVGQSDASAPLDPFVKPKTASAPTKTPTTVKKPKVLPAGVATVTLGVNVNMVPTSQMIKIQGTNLKAGSTTSVKLVVDIGSQRVQKELATRTVGSTGTLSLYAMLNNSLPTGSYKIFVAAIGANGRTVSAEASFLIPQTWNSIAGSLPLLPPASQSSTNKPTTTVPKSTVITIPSTPVSGAGQTTTTISPSGESVPTTQAPTSSSVVTTTSTPTGPGTTVVTTETKNTGGPTITLQLVVVVFTSGFAFAILLILLALLRRRRRDNVSK